MPDTNGRRVLANMTLSLDGRYVGPGGPQDLGWLAPYAVTDVARDLMATMIETATTAVLGRRNAEGFLGFWPSVADNDSADPRDRAYATWLINTEKVVLSSTLTEAPWERTRMVNTPAGDLIDELKSSDGGDILVNSSASVIKDLLQADKLDRLMLMILPVVLGGGERLLVDGLPGTTWSVTNSRTGDNGAMSVTYDRVR